MKKFINCAAKNEKIYNCALKWKIQKLYSKIEKFYYILEIKMLVLKIFIVNIFRHKFSKRIGKKFNIEGDMLLFENK